MTDTINATASPDTNTDKLVIDGVELGSRLIMGTGGAPSLGRAGERPCCPPERSSPPWP